jgi:glycosyltransferase involved in cell wall biosynthesis
MLAGVPVVATDVGGVRECVEPGESGLLVRPDDADALAAALRRLVADRSLAARLADEARRRARERFGAPTMAAAYERLYAEVLAR